jgi:hypothetical protein
VAPGGIGKLPTPFALIVLPEPPEPVEPPEVDEVAGDDEPDDAGGALEAAGGVFEAAGGELDDADGVVIPPWHAQSDTPARQAATSAAAVRYIFIARWSFRGCFVRSPAKLDSRLAGRIALLSQLCDT